MSKIKKYITSSPLLNIKIKYKSEIFKFNLYDELIINEDKINTEIKEQPSYYGFIGLLLVKLQRQKDDIEAELNKVDAKLFIKYKTNINLSTNRENSKDLAEALVKDDRTYQDQLTRFNKVKESVGIIQQCLRAFDQRSHLLQSLSANRRREI
jgi:hypothetical protein